MKNGFGQSVPDLFFAGTLTLTHIHGLKSPLQLRLYREFQVLSLT
jgi:hypothetical protein